MNGLVFSYALRPTSQHQDSIHVGQPIRTGGSRWYIRLPGVDERICSTTEYNGYEVWTGRVKCVRRTDDLKRPRHLETPRFASHTSMYMYIEQRCQRRRNWLTKTSDHRKRTRKTEPDAEIRKWISEKEIVWIDRPLHRYCRSDCFNVMKYWMFFPASFNCRCCNSQRAIQTDCVMIIPRLSQARRQALPLHRGYQRAGQSPTLVV
jgi:hypothetical protein